MCDPFQTLCVCVCVQFLGCVGLVNRVDIDEKMGFVTFYVRNARFHVIMAALKKVRMYLLCACVRTCMSSKANAVSLC